jgi:hypothetical protein
MQEFKVTCQIGDAIGPRPGHPHEIAYFCEASDATDAKDMVLLNFPDMRHAEITVEATGAFMAYEGEGKVYRP